MGPAREPSRPCVDRPDSPNHLPADSTFVNWGRDCKERSRSRSTSRDQVSRSRRMGSSECEWSDSDRDAVSRSHPRSCAHCQRPEEGAASRDSPMSDHRAHGREEGSGERWSKRSESTPNMCGSTDDGQPDSGKRMIPKEESSTQRGDLERYRRRSKGNGQDIGPSTSDEEVHFPPSKRLNTGVSQRSGLPHPSNAGGTLPKAASGDSDGSLASQRDQERDREREDVVRVSRDQLAIDSSNAGLTGSSLGD